MRAWVFQDSRQLKKLGSRCPWSCGWVHNGRRLSRKIGTKTLAKEYARQLEGEHAAGLVKNDSREKWSTFRQDYEKKVLALKSYRHQESTKKALDNFERIAKPNLLKDVTTEMIDGFVAVRRTERGKKPGSVVSPCTTNRELRSIRAALQVAVDWKKIGEVPKVRKLKESDEIGRVMDPDHFEQIFVACQSARFPKDVPCGPEAWWQAFLLMAMTTGWRVGDLLAFRRDDLDIETGRVLTRARDNKASRDDCDYLVPVALAYVRQIVSFDPCVFAWPHHRTTLWCEFRRIQESAGINLPCPDADEHQCTNACRYYGLHSLRRGFATMNADSMPSAVLQKKMRHASFSTTLRYVSLSNKLKKATDAVHVPEFLRNQAAN